MEFAASAGGSAALDHVKSAEKPGVICTTAFAAHAATPLPELRRFAPETLAPTDTLPCETNLTGLGLAADGRLLCGSSKSIDAETVELTTAAFLRIKKLLPARALDFTEVTEDGV